MKTSESIKEISLALSKAQSEIGSAKKDTANPFFKSKYADLGAVIGAFKDALNRNGITFLQPVSSNEHGVTVETILLHASGEWISDGGEMTLPVSKHDAQGVGSAISYGRRYGAQSLLGIPSEDDDGNAATTAAPKKMGSSARDTAVEALNAFPLDQQKFLHDEAHKIEGASKDMTPPDLHEFIEIQHYDNEEKLAIWALLPSDVRSKIKRGKPVTNGELSTQP